MKKLLRTVLRTIAALLGIVLVYIVLVLLLPYIEVPAKPTTDPKTTTIFILSNGVHTDIVVPVKSSEYDWSKEIRFADTQSKSTDFQYVGIGWGDKGFYLDTPTWAELKFSTAIKAAFWMSESAMHCTFYNNFPPDEEYHKIVLTQQQYQELIQYIRKKFDRDKNGNTIKVETNAVYGKNDVFYEAKGTYSFLETCNTWTNRGLKVAGQKAALWTATDFGIFRHYEEAGN